MVGPPATNFHSLHLLPPVLTFRRQPDARLAWTKADSAASTPARVAPCSPDRLPRPKPFAAILPRGARGRAISPPGTVVRSARRRPDVPLTSILRSVSTSGGPAMCSGTSTHSCAYPTATGSHATVCAHSCRHMQRYQPSRHGLSRSPALAQLSTWQPTGVQIP